MKPWIVCQLGAREHYAIPRALHQAGQLHSLVTDAWVTPQSKLNKVPGLTSLCDRYHPDLSTAPVNGFTPSLIQFEIIRRMKKATPWDCMMARNKWFQYRALTYLDSLESTHSQPFTLFSYSYAALDLLRYAKKRGWRTILGQIDPGIAEEKIVVNEQAKHPDLAPDWQPVPPHYWSLWQQECELADSIVVNSAWSKQLLAQAGVELSKIRIVPLVYTPPSEAQAFERTYPKIFSGDRPLRVLFLGLVTLRKGISALLEAVTQLRGKPIEFWIVGSQDISLPDELLNCPQIRWIGPVPRNQVQIYYQKADIFLFPTLSDGFGLTQLEAQAWQLPLITSNHCGEVTQDGVNGLKLSEVNPSEIVSALESCLRQPQQLFDFAKQSSQPGNLGLCHLKKALLSI